MNYFAYAVGLAKQRAEELKLPTAEVQTCGPTGQAVNGTAGVSSFSSPLKIHDGGTIERLIAATERICK